MTYTKNALRRTVVLFGFTAVGSIAAYLFRFVLARSLSPAEYGLFWAVYSLIFFFNFFADLGLGSAVVKFIPELEVEKKFDEIKGTILYTMKVQTVVALFGALAFILLAPWLTTQFFHDEQATILIYILAATFALFPFNTLLNALHGFQNMFAYAAISAGKNVIAAVVAFFLLNMGLKVTAPAWGYLVAYAMLPVLSLFFLTQVNFKSFFHVTSTLDEKRKKELVRFGLPIMLTTLGSIVIGYTDTMMLTYFRSLEEVGLYNVALPLAMALWLGASSINTVMLPMSSEMWARGHKKSLQTGITSLYRYLLIGLVPATLLLMTFPTIIITLLFGQNYATAASALQILAVGALTGSIGLLNNSILSGIGKPTLVSKTMTAAVVVNVLLNALLIPVFGINGSAIATTLSFTTIFLVSLINLERVIEVKIPAMFWIKMASAAAMFVIVVTVLKSILDLHPILEAIVALGAAGTVYAMLLMMFSILNFKEIKHLLQSAIVR